MPEIEKQPKSRPRQCPYCGSYILQRWGRIVKPVRDTHELEVEVHRYRCCDCGRTFRAYPAGVDRAERTIRLRHLAALAWALGLSLEQVVNLFHTFGIRLSRTTIWRDGQEMVAMLPNGRRTRLVRVLSGGNNSVWLDDHEGGVIVILELKRSKKVMLEMTDESNTDQVHQLLSPIVSQWGLEMDVF